MIDCPTSAATRPPVEIASGVELLGDRVPAAAAQTNGYVRFADRVVTVDLDSDRGDLVGMDGTAQMVSRDLIDEITSETLKDAGAVVGGAVVMPDGISERIVASVHRPAVIVQLLPNRLARCEFRDARLLHAIIVT